MGYQNIFKDKLLIQKKIMPSSFTALLWAAAHNTCINVTFHAFRKFQTCIKSSHMSLQRISTIENQGANLVLPSEIYTNTILENCIISETLDNSSIKISYNNV